MEKTNSVRSILQATYTPRLPPLPEGTRGTAERAWDKWNFIQSINPSSAELKAVLKQITDKNKISAAIKRDIKIVSDAMNFLQKGEVLSSVSILATLDKDNLKKWQRQQHYQLQHQVSV
jgi:hypothetical protein